MASSYNPSSETSVGYQNTEDLFHQPSSVPCISAGGRVPTYHPIMPKPMQSCNQLIADTNDVTPMENYQKCKRRLQFSPYYIPELGLQRQYITSTGTTRRNARERNRVKTINSTFAKLREHLPQSVRGRKTRKMSKVDTLRAAIEYISGLQDLLDNEDAVNAVFNFTPSETEEAVPSPTTSQLPQDHFHAQSDFSAASFSPCSSFDEAQSPSSNSSCSPTLDLYRHTKENEELNDFNGWF